MITLRIIPGTAPGYYVLSGNIDEFLDITFLKTSLQEQLVLNLNGIRRINSMGVKRWVEELEELRDQGKSVIYEECPEVFMRICSISSTFAQVGKYRSFELTFFCEKDDEYLRKMLTVNDLGETLTLPQVRCPLCQRPMILEEENDLNFLKDRLVP